MVWSWHGLYAHLHYREGTVLHIMMTDIWSEQHLLACSIFILLWFCPQQYDIFYDKDYGNVRSDSPGKVLHMIILQENFTLANNPALHLEAYQKQSAVVFGDIHCLTKIKCQKFVPETQFHVQSLKVCWVVYVLYPKMSGRNFFLMKQKGEVWCCKQLYLQEQHS